MNCESIDGELARIQELEKPTGTLVVTAQNEQGL